ncbi:MAG: acyl--CoA ligase [Burkholderiales bacterium]|nr:acyl--CoA ligase [Burkholderiales bacterium]
MIVVPQEKIDLYTARGWWGTRTLYDGFAANAAAHPDREAVVDAPNRRQFSDQAPRRLTYGALAAEVERMAAVLLAHGIGKDDVVVVQLPNGVEQFVVYLACARLGVMVSPVPVQYREHELGHVLGITRAKAAVTLARIGRHAHAAMFAALAARHPGGLAVLAWGDALPPATVDLADALARAGDAAPVGAYCAAHPVSANDVFTVCWTSGTEAQPKGVPRSHNEWRIVAPAIIEGAGLQPGCRLLNPFPFVNMAGLSTNFAAWIELGATVVQHHPFDLEVFLGQLREEAIDYTVAAPAILNQLLQRPALLEGIDFRRLASIGSGAAPLSEWMVRGFGEKYGVQIVNYFGSNEGASLTGAPRDVPDPAARAQYFPRAGRPEFDWSVSTARRIRTRLVDLATGADIEEPGRVGELRFAGPTIFSGYFNAPELTARAFDDQGFYRTGDLFEIAGPQNQYYRHVGRSKDLVIRGGMNISSEEVENLVLAHPKVREAAVVGYPDPILGERVCVCVATVDGADLSLEELTAFLRAEKRIAAYKLPERIERVDALPRNPVGKILKRVLRESVARHVEEIR